MVHDKGGWSEKNYFRVLLITHAIQLERKELPVKGEIFESDDQRIGTEFWNIVGKLDWIPVPDYRVFLEASTVGNCAGKRIVFGQNDCKHTVLKASLME